MRFFRVNSVPILNRGCEGCAARFDVIGFHYWRLFEWDCLLMSALFCIWGLIIRSYRMTGEIYNFGEFQKHIKQLAFGIYSTVYRALYLYRLEKLGFDSENYNKQAFTPVCVQSAGSARVNWKYFILRLNGNSFAYFFQISLPSSTKKPSTMKLK